MICTRLLDYETWAPESENQKCSKTQKGWLSTIMPQMESSKPNFMWRVQITGTWNFLLNYLQAICIGHIWHINESCVYSQFPFQRYLIIYMKISPKMKINLKIS